MNKSDPSNLVLAVLTFKKNLLKRKFFGFVRFYFKFNFKKNFKLLKLDSQENTMLNEIISFLFVK